MLSGTSLSHSNQVYCSGVFPLWRDTEYKTLLSTFLKSDFFDLDNTSITLFQKSTLSGKSVIAISRRFLACSIANFIVLYRTLFNIPAAASVGD